ncbi:MAG: hypothetical protein MJK08_13340, partial [Campylobacterales bacterium]|nr:hypothetical protein [Campylobacterales bacterium]
MKLFIRTYDGTYKTQEITENIILEPVKGEQLYFDNSHSDYLFNIIDSGKSIEIIFVVNSERIKVILKGMIPLITETQNLNNQNYKSILGIVNDEEGFRELEETVLNSNYHDNNIIDRLKSLLEESTNSEVSNGVIIDNFDSLYGLLEASSSSSEIQSDLIYAQNISSEIDYKHNLIREKQRLVLEENEEQKENLLNQGREVFEIIENEDKNINHDLTVKIVDIKTIIEDDVSTVKGKEV